MAKSPKADRPWEPVAIGTGPQLSDVGGLHPVQSVVRGPLARMNRRIEPSLPGPRPHAEDVRVRWGVWSQKRGHTRAPDRGDDNVGMEHAACVRSIRIRELEARAHRRQSGRATLLDRTPPAISITAPSHSRAPRAEACANLPSRRDASRAMGNPSARSARRRHRPPRDAFPSAEDGSVPDGKTAKMSRRPDDSVFGRRRT